MNSIVIEAFLGVQYIFPGQNSMLNSFLILPGRYFCELVKMERGVTVTFEKGISRYYGGFFGVKNIFLGRNLMLNPFLMMLGRYNANLENLERGVMKPLLPIHSKFLSRHHFQ